MRFSTRITSAEKKAVQGVLDSENLSSFYRNFRGGENIQAFEREFAEYLGVKHAVSVCHGTCAIFLALKCLPLKPRSRIAVPAYTFVGTVSPVLAAGHEPVFIDSDYFDYNMSSQDLYQCLYPPRKNKIRACIPVHLLGTPVPWRIEKAPVLMIEDACQCLGGRIGNRMVGSIGFISCHSMQETKSVTSLGEGGMLCTNDALVYETALNLRNHGDKNRDAKYACWNLRLSESAAAFGRVQLQRYPEILKEQIGIAGYLMRQLPPCLHPQECLRLNTSTRYILGTQLESGYDRDRVVSEINRRLKIKTSRPGWTVSRGYDRLVSDLPAYKKYARPCPNARTILAHSVWFDIRAGTRETVNTLLQAVEKAVK